MSKKTHVMVNKPEISVRYLADYMAASERSRRTIVSNIKFRPIARLIQHKEATLALTEFIVSGRTDAAELKAKSDYIRSKLADDDFELIVNEANADYLARVSQILGDLCLPSANLSFSQSVHSTIINGVKVKFSPHILLDRRTRTNKTKRGALMIRYAKGKPLNPPVAKFQCAAILGLLRDTTLQSDEDEADKALCLTVDAYAGQVYSAQGDAATDYANMKAALASIAERWDKIPPPKNAVI